MTLEEEPFGELEIEEAGAYPALIQTRLIEEHSLVIKKWIFENFQISSKEYYDFSDFQNEDELEYDSRLDPLGSQDLVKMAWGSHLDDIEINAIAVKIDKDGELEWRPATHRITVEEVEAEDEIEPTLKNIKAMIPAIRQHLDKLTEVIPDQMGHNAPPEMYAFTAEELKTLQSKLLVLEKLPDDASLEGNALLTDIAKQASKVSVGVIKYALKKGDIFASNFAESAGDASGKWAVRALILYMAGNGLKQFAELLLAAAGAS